MPEPTITTDIMEYLVWVVEITAAQFFGGDKTSAYRALKGCGLWEIYVEHYETTHTLGKEYLLEEIGEYFAEHGVETSGGIADVR
jgi:hypothetical protein